MKLDIEKALDNIQKTLLARLNLKLVEIDTEKNDTIKLKPVSDKAYIFQSLDEAAINYDPVLYYGIESSNSVSTYGATAKTVQIEVSVILADSQDKNIFKRLFRYQRALEEIFTENYSAMKNMSNKVKITGLEPIGFKMQNSTSEFKAIGVMIELDLFS